MGLRCRSGLLAGWSNCCNISSGISRAGRRSSIVRSNSSRRCSCCCWWCCSISPRIEERRDDNGDEKRELSDSLWTFSSCERSWLGSLALGVGAVAVAGEVSLRHG
ncbi:hypothetical protein BDW75DRAFT_210081 [Aspergillus navahoensis]